MEIEKNYNLIEIKRNKYKGRREYKYECWTNKSLEDAPKKFTKITDKQFPKILSDHDQ